MKETRERKPAVHKTAERAEEKRGNINKRMMVMTAVLVALVIIAGIQTIALFDLNNKASEKIEKIPKAATTIPTGSSGGGDGGGLELPSMVGGC